MAENMSHFRHRLFRRLLRPSFTGTLKWPADFQSLWAKVSCDFGQPLVRTRALTVAELGGSPHQLTWSWNPRLGANVVGHKWNLHILFHFPATNAPTRWNLNLTRNPDHHDTNFVTENTSNILAVLVSSCQNLTWLEPKSVEAKVQSEFVLVGLRNAKWVASSVAM